MSAVPPDPISLPSTVWGALDGYVNIDHAMLDHIGIAVRSIAVTRVFYETLGLTVSQQETVEHEQVNTAMLALGGSRIELLEPTAEDSIIGRFLARHGGGIHHIALRLPQIVTLFERLRASGIRLASDRIGIGAGGHRYFFIHPASAGGVLIEIVGDAEESA